MKKYITKQIQFTMYNLISGVLLLPFFFIFAIDIIARIAQGDLVHYNRPVYTFLSHTPLYWTPILFSVVILFPTLALLLILISLFQNIIKKHTSLFSVTFVKQNMGSLILLVLALGFLAIIKLHDFAPCMLHGILIEGSNKIFHIFSVCRNA